MKTVREVKNVVDSRLENTEYKRCDTMYNDKRKTCRRFKMFVIRRDYGDCTGADLSSVEMLLEGETNFVRYYDGYYFTNHIPGCNTYKRNSGTVMCFVWYIALD